MFRIAAYATAVPDYTGEKPFTFIIPQYMRR
jgi:hypothetical protein